MKVKMCFQRTWFNDVQSCSMCRWMCIKFRAPADYSPMQQVPNCCKSKTSDILEQLHQVIDTWYYHETLRNDRGDTKTMTCDTHVCRILLHTLNPQERWGTHKKQWPLQPRPFADVIGLVRRLYLHWLDPTKYIPLWYLIRPVYRKVSIYRVDHDNLMYGLEMTRNSMHENSTGLPFCSGHSRWCCKATNSKAMDETYEMIASPEMMLIKRPGKNDFKKQVYYTGMSCTCFYRWKWWTRPARVTS